MKVWLSLLALLLVVLMVGSLQAELTYTVSIGSSGTIEIPSLIDSLSFDYYGATVVLAATHPSTTWTANSAVSQSFTGQTVKIGTAQFYLRRGSTANPTGSLYAVLYSHTGTYGVDSAPLVELARSDPIDAASLSFQTTGYRAINFTFSGDNQITLSAGTKYCIALLGTGAISQTDKIEVAAANNAHAGNYAGFRNGVWMTDDNIDVIFKVYGVSNNPTPSPTPTPTPPSQNDNVIPIPESGQLYHMAFCSWDSAAPLPDEGRRDINRFVSIVGKELYAAENAGTICVGEDFWPMREPNSWEPLLDEGLFDVFIFSLNPYLRSYPSDTDTVNGPTATEWKIANGDYNSWLSTLAQQLKDFDYPVMLKIGIEMNGNEGQGSWVADYGATPAAFIAAWQHIVDYLRTAGVTNVDWCISYTFESVGPYDFADYYPGSNYVDWIGIDLYQISASDDPEHQLSVFYTWAKNLGKPLGVTEWGVNWYNKALPDADRARYINDFFDAIEAKPEFKFIRYHWNYWWRFQDDDPSDSVTYMPLASEAYRTRIADSRYLTVAAG